MLHVGQPRFQNPRRFWLNTNDLVRVRTGEHLNIQYFQIFTDCDGKLLVSKTRTKRTKRVQF